MTMSEDNKRQLSHLNYQSQQAYLLPKLRSALNTLYSLPLNEQFTQQQQYKFVSSQNAHEYLVEFQSRNILRKLRSRDALEERNESILENNEFKKVPQQAIHIEDTDCGSSWLACLSLLSSLISPHPVHHAEALFAAQTMVHRLRKMKLCDAIDVEIEPPAIYMGETAQESIVALFDTFSRWKQALGFSFCDFPAIRSNSSENDVKGEAGLLLLGELVYSISFKYHRGKHESEIRTILSALASAMAVISARLRFTPKMAPHPNPDTQQVVTMIILVLKHVHQKVLAKACIPQEELMMVYSFAFYTCMTVIPDAILDGCGDTGRLSMEPQCFSALATEVRNTGFILTCQFLLDLPKPENEFKIMFFRMCEGWIKYVPLNSELMSNITTEIEIAFSNVRSPPSQTNEKLFEAKAAMRCWIAIMEAGSWDVDQVLSAVLLQTSDSSQQGGKKRQSNRSKKRQKNALEERTTSNLALKAQDEIRQRGIVACQTAKRTWDSFRNHLAIELVSIGDNENNVRGDGAICGVSVCANSCLPFLLRQPETHEQLELFECIAHAVQDLCRSESRDVRGFASEPLYILQVTLAGLSIEEYVGQRTQEVIVNLFIGCSISLAMNCAYPQNYFDHLGEKNDELVENERNDVRDVLRSVTNISHAEFKQIHPAVANISGFTLLGLLKACSESILLKNSNDEGIFPEAALHAFSAFTKSINSWSAVYLESPSDLIKNILGLVLDIMMAAGEHIICFFSEASIAAILPLSRLYNLAAASLSPTFSLLCKEAAFEKEISSTVAISILVATESLLKLPELAAPSSLRSSRYDIRGAMRSPGGEDHVGCLVLMRMAYESDALAQTFIKTSDSMMNNLCQVYLSLKTFENERSPGILHGIGVLPKSRRILLGVLCRLATLPASTNHFLSVLENMFIESVNAVVSLQSHLQKSHADTVFFVVEHIFDLAAFSPAMVKHFLGFNSVVPSAIQVLYIDRLHKIGNLGFGEIHGYTHDPRLLHQWNRARAAIFSLLKRAGNPDLPLSVTDTMISWIKLECEAIWRQCMLGPISSSAIFCEGLVSDESIPSGATIRILFEILNNAIEHHTPLFSLQNCIHIIGKVRADILRVMSCNCPSPRGKDSFYDPRPSLSETWLLIVCKLIDAIELERTRGSFRVTNDVQLILVDTCVSAIGLLFFPSLGKTEVARQNDPGMTLDGPHSLVLMEFLKLFFRLGPGFTQSVTAGLFASIPIDKNSVLQMNCDENLIGMAIVGSSLFRAAQGGLPPWAIELIPFVYSSIYHCIDCDNVKFRNILEMSLSLRIKTQDHLGGVLPGGLLSGTPFEKLKEQAKYHFLNESAVLAGTNTPASWKCLKVLVKKLCGGKKKDTDFGQKPSLTRWDSLDRC